MSELPAAKTERQWFFWGDALSPFQHEEDFGRKRELVYDTIDNSKFDYWVVFVSGVGFYTDAYDIFSNNMVLPMLSIVYGGPDKALSRSQSTSLNSATLAGSMIGQIFFGVMADVFGRRKMYGMELIVLIVATLGLAMCSSGAEGSMNVISWLVFWRLLIGIGLGGDYPLSAIITSEFAPRKHRACMMASLFFLQSMGQLTSQIVALICVSAAKRHLLVDAEHCGPECIRTVDSTWRWIVGLGAVPAAVALIFRLTIPESPRYVLEVLGDWRRAKHDIKGYKKLSIFDDGERGPSSGSLEAVNGYTTEPKGEVVSTVVSAPTTIDFSPPPARDTSPGPPRPPSTHSTSSANSRNSSSSSSASSHENDDDDAERPQPSLRKKLATLHNHLYAYFITNRNIYTLLGTALSWLLLDMSFYGLGINSPKIVTRIWDGKIDPTLTIYQSLIRNSYRSVVLVSVGSILGGMLAIKVSKHWSLKKLQLYGFLMLAALLLASGLCFLFLIETQARYVLILLYLLCQLFFNFGPNTTTYIIPAELFPTQWRASCYGISAAAGKLGSVLAQVLVSYARFPGHGQLKYYDEEGSKGLGYVLIVFMVFMLAGAVVTWRWIPETKGEDKMSLSLEELAKGREPCGVKVKRKRAKKMGAVVRRKWRWKNEDVEAEQRRERQEETEEVS